ncbi:MAG: DUF488 domain-containing protein [Armatimonadota bacterium]
MIKLKRAYEPPAEEDGMRVLVDRRWPCNVWKAQAKIDLWMKEIAPSEALTVWFNRDPAKWPEFRRRYWGELYRKPELIEELERLDREGTVTLVYRAKDTAHNNALALLQFLEHRARMRKAA